MESLAITKLNAEQIWAVVDARRSLPIPAILGANVLARDFMFKEPEGYKRMNTATNEATRLCRDLGITEAPTLITFQVCSEEYTMAEAVKSRISEEHYDLLTFAFRSVLDPQNVPEQLRQRVKASFHQEKKPLVAAPEPPVAAKTKGRRTAPATPKPAATRPVEAKKFSVSQKQLDELSGFMEE